MSWLWKCQFTAPHWVRRCSVSVHYIAGSEWESTKCYLNIWHFWQNTTPLTAEDHHFHSRRFVLSQRGKHNSDNDGSVLFTCLRKPWPCSGESATLMETTLRPWHWNSYMEFSHHSILLFTPVVFMRSWCHAVVKKGSIVCIWQLFYSFLVTRLLLFILFLSYFLRVIL